MSMGYKKVMQEVIGMPEKEGVYCTNLALFALHYMTVSLSSLPMIYMMGNFYIMMPNGRCIVCMFL